MSSGVYKSSVSYEGDVRHVVITRTWTNNDPYQHPHVIFRCSMTAEDLRAVRALLFEIDANETAAVSREGQA